MATGSEPRLTLQTITILRVLLDSPSEWRYGREIIKAVGVRGGTVYPTLARLENAGWLDRRRESIDPVAEGRPARIHYRLTGEGERAARKALSGAGLGLVPLPASG